MPRLVLYTTAGCHLCEEAASLLTELTRQQAVDSPITIESIEISTDAALVDAYGIRIPVVKNSATNVELGWPFDLADLADLVNPV